MLDYAEKFESLAQQALYRRLEPEQQTFVREIAFTHFLTFQEFRWIVEVYRDMSIWGEDDLRAWWYEQSSQTPLKGVHLKKYLLGKLADRLEQLKDAPTVYSMTEPVLFKKNRTNPVVSESSDKAIIGRCPVASPKTICCNLFTVDAVENCAMGCSYCSIQTFYSDRLVFDRDFAAKLNAVSLEPERFYHIGTGQSSDSLASGNRNGVLDALCQFANNHPNILLELKTKSDNIGYFLEREIPRNLVCSWSLNTPTIIRHEEHFTARFEQRVQAARAVADKGIGVGFHFHPMIHYEGWQKDYREAASVLLDAFAPEEVVFLSIGSLTLIKPVVRQIRNHGLRTKVLQANFVPDPHGKLTYSDDIKLRLFRTLHEALSPWHDKVFMYLCMEKASIWQDVFGYVYSDNEEFEQEFGIQTMGKLYPHDT